MLHSKYVVMCAMCCLSSRLCEHERYIFFLGIEKKCKTAAANCIECVAKCINNNAPWAVKSLLGKVYYPPFEVP